MTRLTPRLAVRCAAIALTALVCSTSSADAAASVEPSAGPTDEHPRFFDPGPTPSWSWLGAEQLERLRIQRHLRMVEQTLRASAPVDLDDAQQAARDRALDALAAYWRSGEFPKNRDVPDRRVPTFIDADGVACAVGHLMIASGASNLAREIATYENNDFVADIDHPELPVWLAANGLTAAEAAWIQPTYGPCGGTYSPVCGVDGITYQCSQVATQCADVQIEHHDWCEDDLEDSETGNHHAVIGEEICKSKPQTMECAVGSTNPPIGMLILLMVATARRRRRVDASATTR
jgi:hypothetical protein